MKIHNKSLMGLVGGLSLVAFQGQNANANLINITQVYLPGIKSGVVANSGISVGPANQGDATVYHWLLTQIPTGYPTAVGATPLTTGATTSLANLSAYVGDYLVVHWGTGQAGNKFFGPNTDFEQVFYIGAGGDSSITLDTPTFTGTVTRGKTTTSKSLAVGGLSGWRIYGGTSVPDAASTAALLGLGLLSMEAFRRQFKGR
jgi:hypothetical protein